MSETPNFVALGVPGYQQVEFDWIQHFWTLKWPTPPAILSSSAAYLPDAHNIIIESFLGIPEVRHPEKHGYERAYICFLEQDMYPHVEFAIRAQSYTEPVVGNLYVRRKWHDQRPLCANFTDIDGGGYAVIDGPTLDRWCDEEPGLHRVDIVAMGCTFIRADVLADWPAKFRPWFKWVPSRWGRGGSDDLEFHLECKELGIETFVDTDPRARCEHEGKMRYNLQTSRDWRERARVVLQTSADPLAEIRALIG